MNVFEKRNIFIIIFVLNEKRLKSMAIISLEISSPKEKLMINFMGKSVFLYYSNLIASTCFYCLLPYNSLYYDPEAKNLNVWFLTLTRWKKSFELVRISKLRKLFIRSCILILTILIASHLVDFKKKFENYPQVLMIKTKKTDFNCSFVPGKKSLNG